MSAIRIPRHAALAVALPALLLAVSAPGHPATAEPAPSRGGSPASAVDRVADFFGAYSDVLHDQGRGRLSDSLREHYLTADLRTRLELWEKEHGGDGVLRTEGTPSSWTVTYGDSGMGHTWTHVVLTCDAHGHSTRTRLEVQSDLATLRISDIHEATSR
ncbi:hypothetical protein ACH427_15640 [Streptomyces sp. NPDC020379]|uniref:hypothetical protein n=1 Tax=Streptomyces sp. NPDC020379 TaxID=3365071 RepID=UPI0037AA2D3E